MDRGRINENVIPRNMLPKTNKAFRNLRILQVALTLLVLVLAAALKVVIILYFQGKNDQLESAKISNEALKRQNKILMQRISESAAVYNGSLYHFSCGRMSWKDAEEYCVSRGSHLTSVTSEKEQEFIYKKGNGTIFWIGLDKQKSSNWMWTDGTPFDESPNKMFWSPGEPNNENNIEQCVNFRTVGLKFWNDEACYKHFKFICKRDCGSSGLCK
uniref:C-type lectin domain family 4 member K-like n=1 Tax=Monodelphis domestica TaxID=13616 RepID=F6V4U5_MONDO